MDKERKDIKLIFSEALEKKTAKEQTAYLDKACGNDINLRKKVEALLKAYDEADDVPETPIISQSTFDISPLTEGPGTVIGRYKLLQQIGEGGFGVVYMAEQAEPIRRRVALKIIKLGMDTKQVIARFEAERQALALMDHPNIAKVLDAGATDTGRPYFVMELVKGISITEYCDENNLDTQKRLKLFIDVCKAVQHAHQKGIIHRDIKPTNVLITLRDDDSPVPKIIDFGIAKATQRPLTEKTLFTEFRQFVGTPQYMSPEQARMSEFDVDTRSDIYSLGVLLYELLTGATPFDAETLRQAGYSEMQRIIREEAPAKPSTKLSTLGESLTDVARHRRTQPDSLTKLIRGDLDWIVLKTLEKDRIHRYETANELARDIERHLGDEPVIAGPPSAVYRLRKFVQRNRTSVAVVMSIAAALVIGLALTTIGFIQASRQRDAAKQARTAEAQQRQIAEQAQNAEAKQRQIAEEETKRAMELAETQRKQLYFNHIALADMAYRDNNIRRVRELLDSCPEDLRGWEWYRLNHISNRSIMTLRERSGSVYGVAISPDGKWIVSCGEDKTIKAWDAATGTEIKAFDGHEGPAWAVEFSPDGKWIVSAGSDKMIKIWDMASGEELMTLHGHKSSIYSVTISPDGKQIVSGSQNGTIKVWDAASGEELLTLCGHTGRVFSVAFSPDGRRIASGGRDRTVKIWDAITGAELMTLYGHRDMVWSVAFSPDGKRIFSGCRDDTTKLWNLETGNEIKTFYGHAMDTLGPDGRRIVSSASGTIYVWDATSGADLMTLRGHESLIYSLAFGPDGERIVSSSMDGTIKVWNINLEIEHLALRVRKDGVQSVAFSPDGKRLMFVSTDRTIKVWDLSTGTEVTMLYRHAGRVKSVAFSPDGKRIVSGSNDGTIKVWDAETGDELMTLLGHKKLVLSVAFSPDSKRIVSGSIDETIKIWDAENGTEVMTIGNESYVSAVAFSPDGKHLVSGSYYGTVNVWDVETGAELMTLNGHSGWIELVAFSPDGKRIVTRDWGGTIRMWDAATGAEVIALSGHYGAPACVTFSPDGRRMVSGNGVNTAKVWDVATGTELITLHGYSGWVKSVAFSPDGKTIAIGGSSGITLLESEAPVDGYGPRRTGATARGIVDELYEKYGFYQKVIDALATDSTLKGSVRQLARQIANTRLWEDAEKLHTQGWGMARLPGREIEAYRVALGKLEKANRLDPSIDRTLGKLGVAQYRVGAYEDAIKTLIHAQKMRTDDYFQPRPVPLAFIAMALRQLGRAKEAQAALNRLHVLFEDSKWAQLAKSHGAIPFVIEAEKLFAGENTKLHSAWKHIENEKYDEALQLVKELRSLTGRENIEINKQIKGAAKWLGRSYYNLAESRRRSDTYAQMFAGYEKVIAIDPEHAGALNVLGWLLVTCPIEDLRDSKKAVEYATRACELTDWKNHDYLSTLAAACSETSDFATAVKWQQKAIELLDEDKRDEWQANYQQRLKLYESDKSYHMDNRWSFSAGELVAWWKLDEIEGDKVTDSSGNGLDGKLAGSAKTITDPERGNVLSLDGNGYVDCVNNSAFDITASITVAVWIKVNAFDKAHQSIVTRGVSSWWIYRKGSTNNLSFDCGGLSNDTCTSITGNVNDGKWHHVVGTYDGQKLCLYIDGNINNSVNATGLINLSQENVYIGAINKDVSTEFNGLIDDVRIYSYALSPGEITAIYAGDDIGN